MLWVSASTPVAAVIDGRQVDGELGIGEHDLGQEVRREDDALHVGDVVGDHRAAPDLAAGAGRGRQGDEVRHRVPIGRAPGHLVLVVEQVAGVGGHQGDGLGHVERALRHCTACTFFFIAQLRVRR